jgi:glycosyltransferase involved in cell wall biosynthesis
MSKSVSVVIPTYNYGRFIADAIRSVVAQTLAPVEIIVVDDGSTDDTAAVVGEFGENVKYIFQKNGGVCSARNLGVAESQGELIAFLDADDIWEPTKLEKQVAKFDASEDIGLVHCGMRVFDSDSGETIFLYLDGGEEGVAENLLLWEDSAVNVSGSVILVNRKAFDKVGGFDTEIKCGEDWDFCYRVARQFSVGFVPEPLVNYRSHAAAAHRNVHEMERGMSLFYEKAFADPAVAHLRSRAFGKFHRVMAGSYFHSGEYAKFISHSLRSIFIRPRNLAYFLKFPTRYYSRRRGADSNTGSDSNS